MSKYIVDIHGEIEGDYEIVSKYEEQEPFINKPCVSSEVCEHDKNVVIDKIRAEIDEVYEELDGCDPDSLGTFACRIDDILDKYKAESERT